MLKNKKCLELLSKRRKMFLWMSKKSKIKRKEHKFWTEQMIWEMRIEMMSKILIKWLCMLKLLPLEINNWLKRKWFMEDMLKKKNKKILWLKLIDCKPLKMPKKEKESTKLNKNKTMKWSSNKSKKENCKESELKKK